MISDVPKTAPSSILTSPTHRDSTAPRPSCSRFLFAVNDESQSLFSLILYFVVDGEERLYKLPVTFFYLSLFDIHIVVIDGS